MATLTEQRQPITLRLDPDSYRAVRIEAARQSIPAQELIRRYIDAGLDSDGAER